jgi:BMFP domain-containing protein YqiC
MQNTAFFDNLQSRINKLIDESPAADIRKNLRALLQQGFEHFDLATREQLDLQTDLLARAQARIAELEARMTRLEAGANAPGTTPR